MKEIIESLLQKVITNNIQTAEEFEAFRSEFLSKKGKLNELFDKFKELPKEQKKEIGQILNTLKQKVNEKYEELEKKFSVQQVKSEKHDLTCTSDPIQLGSRHPISIIRNQIISIFERIGFTISEGPEIEDDWHVFSALNFPKEHPARDMQDTFFIRKNPDILLRTHTSSVQIRVMESQEPPIRIIMPGRVYRNEDISARAHCFFHQLEGLYIDKKVSFADLKQTLLYFAREMFGSQTKIRLRPSFFPFTEPSAEMDISCNLCGGEGCAFCKYTGWVEILGCGMVDPNVLENSNISSKEFTGYAFGLGIERIANLKFRVNDIRLFSENDIRFLKQFTSVI